MDSLKDALSEALGERKLKGGFNITIAIEPKDGGDMSEGSPEEEMAESPDQERQEQDGFVLQKPTDTSDDKEILRSMLGAKSDEASAEADMQDRKPSSLGERAKLEGLKRLKEIK